MFEVISKTVVWTSLKFAIDVELSGRTNRLLMTVAFASGKCGSAGDSAALPPPRVAPGGDLRTLRTLDWTPRTGTLTRASTCP
ncbi:hypothetical protein RR46_12120 [Papilio xuthus]|uniref:Uncharacterized protein n=1 Tax=Papilio xuthus TaxID=66420 RepID=A0A194PNW0_PAPXU|nr:hypothetical protein RR46_12120 [Papilio xuthus]